MFGIQCAFTQRVIDELSAQGFPPVALLLPGHPAIEQPLTVTPPGSTLPLVGAAKRSKPYSTYRVGQLASPAALELVSSLTPDYIVVACYPRLIPRRIRHLARVMALNVHPSLLPQHRGPDPLFWIMRDGGAGCGVTVHELSGRFDAGRIVAQQAVPYPEGAREADVESVLAAVGARLVADLMASGEASTTHAVIKHEESYESWPTEADYVVPAGSSVRLAWTFIRGVAERGIPITVMADTGTHVVTDAVAHGHDPNLPDAPDSNEVICAFHDGWLRAIAHDPTGD